MGSVANELSQAYEIEAVKITGVVQSAIGNDDGARRGPVK